ncbi:MAG TPA: amidohydrolase [Candidatus Saccharimonadales bacterium]|nr:amidohydrolase [Candidatus Saccharimonadales bacterium]
MSTAEPSPQLELLFVNGHIRRSAEDRHPVQALGLRGGRIIAAGSTADLRSLAAPATRVIDLDGRTVLPAFTDSHTHFHRGAVLRHVFLDFAAIGPRSVADVLTAVRERSAALPGGTWLQGDSLSPGRLAEGRLPDRHELDGVAGHRPVLLRGIGKHVVAANSAALAAAGIDRETADPPGGRIERDDAGEPTGVLHERAKLRLDTSHPETVVPAVGRAERHEALRAGVRELHRLGITTIHEMVRSPEEAEDLATLHAAGQLDLRVRIFYRVHETPLSLDWLIGLGIRRGRGDDWFRILGIKISVDGWCIFRNAAVYEGYLGEPENLGIMRIDPAALAALVRRANDHGLGIALHAVGGRAVDAALDAFASAGPPVAGPHRLEHAHLDLEERQLDRIRSLGLVLSAQPAFLPAYRVDWARGLAPDRMDRIMPLAAAHRRGIPLILNSDFPSGPLGPLAAIDAAVTRDAGEGHRIGADQAIPREVAWSGFTSVPARASGDAHAGSLAIGHQADLIVFEKDPLDERTDLATLSVSETMLDGRFVYGTDGVAA